MRRGRSLRRLLPAVAGVLISAAARVGLAQDLAPRRGFKVEIREPESGGAVTGRTTIRARSTRSQCQRRTGRTA